MKQLIIIPTIEKSTTINVQGYQEITHKIIFYVGERAILKSWILNSNVAHIDFKESMGPDDQECIETLLNDLGFIGIWFENPRNFG